MKKSIFAAGDVRRTKFGFSAFCLGLCLCLWLSLTGSFSVSAADAGDTEGYELLTVGTPTPFEGKFFSDLWGNAVSDQDVRSLLHGYNLVRWDSREGMFALDPAVVSGAVVTRNAQGDHIYTLTLYQDLYYNDGTPITARDYAFSILLSLAPEIAKIGAKVREAAYISGYRAYVEGRSPALRGVRLQGDDTLSITIDHEALPHFYELGLLDCIPYPAEVIAPGCMVVDEGDGIRIVSKSSEEEETEETEDTEDTEETGSGRVFTKELLQETILNRDTGYLSHPFLSSGPYRLVSYDGSTVEVVRNPYYKGNADGVSPTIDRIRYRVVPYERMMDLLEAGEVDLLSKCADAQVISDGIHLIAQNRESSGRQQFSMSSYARSGLACISFCCERETVCSALVRQAVACCLDKNRLTEDYTGNYGTPVDGYYGMGQWMVQVLEGSVKVPAAAGEDTSDARAMREYEEELEAWEALRAEDVPGNRLDLNAAAQLLEEDGWILNAEGNPYDPIRDDVRFKQQNDALTPLRLRMIYPEGNRIGKSLEECFAENLRTVGAELEMEAQPMQELLRQYYREEKERSCDMIFLGTNFELLFDPSITFCPENATGLTDEKLYGLALAMRSTQPGDVLEYCRRWLAFQKAFIRTLPLIPVYSNVYFDFYTTSLQNYHVQDTVSWTQAILESRFGDPPQPGIGAGLP